MRPFAVELTHELLHDLHTVKPDLSCYYDVFQQTPPSGIGVKLKRAVQLLMRRFRTVRVELDNHSLRASLQTFDPYWDGLQNLYELLADESSRRLLVKLMAHRLLGALHVTLPADTPRYRDLYARARSLEDQTVTLDAQGWRLFKMNLESYGHPITLMAHAPAVLATFGMKQYDHRTDEGQTIGAQPDDVVIDAGGCWGDTALFFAERVGPRGRVLSFEFDPSNLEVFRQNLNWNPALADRITIVEQPLWEEAGRPLSIESNGPGTRITVGQTSAATPRLLTTSIDQIASDRQLPKVDFIKMDIEGSEQPALRGAVQTLQRHRPRLAISLYHSLDDFVQIPRWIDALDLNYRFYLGHETIFDAETILFAVPA